jgi:hypothetical protein
MLAFARVSLLAAMAVFSAPARAQDVVDVLATAEVHGPAADAKNTSSWNRRFAPGASLAVSALLVNQSSGAVTLAFADPTDVADFALADAFGNDVAFLSIGGAPSLELAPGTGGQRLAATWDQTDFAGNRLPSGIYSVVASINSDPPQVTAPTYFQIGSQDSPASAFAFAIGVDGGPYRPAEPVAARLTALNLTGAAQAIRFDLPGAAWALGNELDFRVLNAAGDEVYRWSQSAPKGQSGPVDVTVDPLGAFDFGPAVWPGVDAQGWPVAAGTYTLEMSLRGSAPKVGVETAAVEISGDPDPFVDLHSWDVIQRNLGDCSLTAAMASVAHTRGDLLRAMIAPAAGGFLVSYHDPTGNPAQILVTQAMLDADQAKHWAGEVVPGVDGVVLWPAVLEAGFMSAVGLHAGHLMNNAFEFLTGAPPANTKIKGGDPDAVWQAIVDGAAASLPMVADCGATEDGLVPHHYFSVFDASEDPDGTRWVHLRNPWGATAKGADKEGHPGGQRVPFADFLRDFDTLSVGNFG